MEIIFKVNSLEERLFYIHRCAVGFWSYRELQRQIKSDLYHKEGTQICFPIVFPKRKSAT